MLIEQKGVYNNWANSTLEMHSSSIKMSKRSNDLKFYLKQGRVGDVTVVEHMLLDLISDTTHTQHTYMQTKPE